MASNTYLQESSWLLSEILANHLSQIEILALKEKEAIKRQHFG